MIPFNKPYLTGTETPHIEEAVRSGKISGNGIFISQTINIISGESGILAINDDRFIHRAEIIWEKGRNGAEFFRGKVNKYGWVDTGSSFLPLEVIAAFCGHK